jgi:hypothetical protein
MGIPLVGAVADGIGADHAYLVDVVFAWLPESAVIDPANRLSFWEYERYNSYWHPAVAQPSQHERVADTGQQRLWFELAGVVLVMVAMSVMWGRAGLAAFKLAIFVYMWGGAIVVSVLHRSQRRSRRDTTPSAGSSDTWNRAESTYPPAGT